MSREFELSRRKILGAVGGVGLASAGAGMGTTAFLSDTESFEGNRLTAGELDLKVDWEEHYYDGSNKVSSLRYVDSVDDVKLDEVGLPDPSNPLIAVDRDELDAFMAGTAIEAFPDPDNDGSQEIETESFTYDPCRDGADLDADLDPTTGGPAVRTDNDDTYVDGEVKPLISLDDVKPGDFGEVTFSFHLCDNPGYVWLQLSNVTESGGTNPEPEQEAEGDEDNDANLKENIQTIWWYDDGDNVLEPGLTPQGECEETLYLSDHSSSKKADLFSVEISGGNATTTKLADIDEFDASHIGASNDGNTVYVVSEFTDELARYDVQNDSYDVSPIDLNGNGPLGDVVQAAVDTDGALWIGSKTEDALFKVSDPDGSPKVTKRIDLDIDIEGADSVFASNGQFYLFTNSTKDLYAVNLISGATTSVASLSTNEDLTGLAVLNGGSGDFVGSVSQGTELIEFDANGTVVARYDLAGDLTAHTYGDLTTGELCEQVFRSGGTLAEDVEQLSADVLPVDGGRCFQPGFTRHIGFAWWVPPEVENEIQGDSVEFDVGFYTEQCRHNDSPSGPSA